MRPTFTKKYLAFILLVIGMFSFSVADAQFICDCISGRPPGICYVNDRGQNKCFKFKKNGGTFFVNSQIIESASPGSVLKSNTISFFLEQSQKASLKVFDMNGRLVSILADKMFEAGENKLVWKADNVSTGIYFLQFQSAEKLQTEKLIVTK